MFEVKGGGTLRTITTAWAYHGGILRRLRKAQVLEDDTLRTVATFAAPLSVSISPDLVFGYEEAASTVTTSSATAVPSGGSAPFTYAWEIVTSSGFTPSTANSPSSATTTFSKVMAPTTNEDTWRVTVTDSFGTTATDTVIAQFTRGSS